MSSGTPDPTSSPIRTAVWGTGNVGRAAIRSVAAHPALALSHVLVANPDKVGRDAGDLAGLGRQLGVAATNDVDAVLAAGPRRDSSTRRRATSDPTMRSPTSSRRCGRVRSW